MMNCLIQKLLQLVFEGDLLVTIMKMIAFLKKNYRHLFSEFCSRTKFDRTRCALIQTTKLLR